MQLLTVLEAAKALGISKPRVYQLIQNGTLEAQKVSNAWLIDESSVIARKAKKISAGRPSRVSQSSSTKYILMNREHPVLVFDYDASQKTFSSAIEVIDSNRAPLALVSPRGLKPNSSAIKYWWAHRAIPQTRFGVEEKLQELGLDKHYQLPFASFGLSLSDQYWVKPENLDGLNWKDINYFNNGFESIASNIASEKGAAKKDAAYKTAAKRGASKDSKDKQSADKDSENIKSASRDSENRKSAKESDMSSNWLAEVGLNSPDNTSEGELKKTWICKGKKRILLKGSSALGQ